MNILPKKRWHVRTKENIARVRRDEALAAEKEKELERRKQLAESEARLECMRKKVGDYTDVPKDVAVCSKDSTEHVNFFKELEEQKTAGSFKKNKDREKEKQEEKEKYEKQIGYLTYLGQDTVEATGNVSWYNKMPVRELAQELEERDLKAKSKLDPVNKYKKYFFTFTRPNSKQPFNTKEIDESDNSGKKLKKKCRKKCSVTELAKRNKCSSSSLESDTNVSEDEEQRKKARLQILREKRLERERKERIRAEELMQRIQNKNKPECKEQSPPQLQQKYHSQFNPHLARQNAK